MTVKVTVYTDTYLRTGGTRNGPDNRIGHGHVLDPLQAGEYEALAQSPCAEVEEVDPHGHHLRNYWWVRLSTPRGEGWVSAVNVKSGDPDKPIPPVAGVPIPELPCVFEVPKFDSGPTVQVRRKTLLRKGGSTKEPDNSLDGSVSLDSLPPGPYMALAQCTGEEFDDGNGSNNYWWVLLATDGGTGWVTAVDIETGGNDQPIPPVNGVPIPELSTVMVV